MALIVYGPITSQAIGSIAGVVFTQNFHGAFARAKASPVQPQTAPQKAIKGAFAATARMFTSALTPGEINAWNVFAAAHPITNRLGLQRALIGQQWFIRLNTNLKQIGQPLIMSPPASLSITTPNSLSLTEQTSPTTALILTPDVAPAAGIWIQISASPPSTIGRVRPSVRKAVIATVSPSIAPPYDITTAYVKKWGQAAAPAIVHVHAKFINQANGLSAGNLTASTVLTQPLT